MASNSDGAASRRNGDSGPGGPNAWPALAAALAEGESDAREFLAKALTFPSISGREKPFTLWVADWAIRHGFETDLWQADDSIAQAYALPIGKHIPLADRPTLVIRMPGADAVAQGRRKTLVFNAHSDVVDVGNPADWTVDPWSGTFADGQFISRGTCDVKGPLTSALWAMAALKQGFPHGLPCDIFLELVPGEEDCVGLGTLTSIACGHKAHAAIILEPTENRPRPASRGGCRFNITARGKAVHGTVKWHGIDALLIMRDVLSALDDIERTWDRDGRALRFDAAERSGLREDAGTDAGTELFLDYPILRPITVDSVHGGRWQGMVCDQAVCGGYLELLPLDDLSAWKSRFNAALMDRLKDRWPPDAIAVSFSEEYHGHLTDVNSSVCAAAELACRGSVPGDTQGPAWQAFNSGCEAGARWRLDGTPTLVWGPGNLRHAHAADERIRLDDVRQCAEMFTRFCLLWGADAAIGNNVSPESKG